MKNEWAVTGMQKRIAELREVKTMVDERIAILEGACLVMNGTEVVGENRIDGQETDTVVSRRVKPVTTVRRGQNWKTSDPAPAGYLKGFKPQEIEGLPVGEALVKVARAGKGLLYPRVIGHLLVDSGIYPGINPTKAGQKANVVAHGRKDFRRIGTGVFKLMN